MVVAAAVTMAAATAATAVKARDLELAPLSGASSHHG
jgi:hypothetical protein